MIDDWQGDNLWIIKLKTKEDIENLDMVLKLGLWELSAVYHFVAYLTKRQNQPSVKENSK